MAKDSLVSRPVKKSEYVLKFASSSAQKGWRDLVATMRNSTADMWDFLTKTPQAVTPTNYPLEGSLATAQRGGKSFQRWQHKPTLKSSARVWFYVDEGAVYIEQVHTAHPHQTK